MKYFLSILLFLAGLYALMTPYMETRGNMFGLVSESTESLSLVGSLRENGILSSETIFVLSIFCPVILPFLKKRKEKLWIVTYLASFILLGYLFMMLNFTMTFQLFSTEENTYLSFYLSQALSLGASIFLLLMSVKSIIYFRKTNRSNQALQTTSASARRLS